MQWLRLYHDTITDPKFRVIATESGQPLTSVLSVWMSMLINASGSSERGTLQDWDDRFAGGAIDLRGDAVRAIREAMQGIVLDGDRLTGWDKRQRASDDAGGRQRKTRAHRAPKPPNDGGHGGNGHDCDSAATVAGQTENVARQSNGVAGQPLRATDSRLEEDSEADASGAAAPSGSTVVPFPMDDKTKLTRAVLPALEKVIRHIPPSEIRSLLFKAYHKIDPETALDLGARAAVKDDPWPWLCAAIDARIKPKQAAGGRPMTSNDAAAHDLLAALSDPNFTYGVGR